jgi:hypothetical protein
MIDVVHKRCEFLGCKSFSTSFNFPDQKKGKFCVIHKQENMVDVKSKHCEFPKCESLQPRFNFPDQKKGKFCIKHKQETMIDVKHKHCKFLGCHSSSVFNFPDQKKGLFCFIHKKENMVNVVSKYCEFPECKAQQPHFNLPDKKGGRFCFIHKQDNMINVVSKRCEFPECKAQPHFNLPDQTTGKFCAKHKKENMVNVMSKKCEFLGCKSEPHFNLPDQTKAQFCGKHKKENMVNVRSKKCEFLGCKVLPNFNLPDQIMGRFCVIHKKENMIDVKHKRCSHCNMIRASKKFQHNCITCYYFLHPEVKPSPRYLLKETYLREALKPFIAQYAPSYNTIIPNTCSILNRPDVFIELPTHNIDIECDEHQHKSYDPNCSDVRDNNIVFLHSKPTVIIHFNPDNYRDGNALIKGCFQDEPNSFGGYKVIKKEWDVRFKELIKTLNIHLSVVPNVPLLKVFLFYDVEYLAL